MPEEEKELTPSEARESRMQEKVGFSNRQGDYAKPRFASVGTFGTQGRLAGEPAGRRDSGDGIETIELGDDGGVGGSASFPLQPVHVGNNKVRWIYGSVHGIVPKIGTVAILPELDDDDNPELTVTASGILYAKVELADDTYEAENPTLHYVAGDSSNLPADTDEQDAYVLLASVICNDDNDVTGISSVHQGSIDMASCGGVVNYWDLG